MTTETTITIPETTHPHETIERDILNVLDENIPDEYHTEDCDLVTGWDGRLRERSCSCEPDGKVEQALVEMGWHEPDCDLSEEEDEDEGPGCSCENGHGPARRTAREIFTEVLLPLLDERDARIAELEKENANLRTLSDAVLGVIAAVDSLKPLGASLHRCTGCGTLKEFATLEKETGACPACVALTAAEYATKQNPEARS